MGQPMDWNERYRPRTLADVTGNTRAIQALETWARAWQHGHPKKRAAILSGPPGCGKTVTAHALGADLGWEVVELNASDHRDAESIQRIATAGALNQTFDDGGAFLRASEGGRKLIVLDEADNIHGREDRGGIRAIVDTIRRTKQPLILIVNDLYELTRQSSTFKTACETIKFQALQTRSVRTVLSRIAALEHLEVEAEALDALAERSSGDVRSAINDLQALSEGKTYVLAKDVGAVGRRDVRSTMYDAVRTILRTDNLHAARRVVSELEETPDFLLLWLSENVPAEYREPRDLARAMEALARADLFLARAQRTKNYRLWAYANDLMAAGVATAKDHAYAGAGRYRFPMWLATMGRTRGLRATTASLASKLAWHCHTAVGVAREDLVPLYQRLFELDGAFALHQTAGLELTEPEVALLLRDEPSSSRVEQLVADAYAPDAGRTQIEPFGKLAGRDGVGGRGEGGGEGGDGDDGEGKVGGGAFERAAKGRGAAGKRKRAAGPDAARDGDSDGEGGDEAGGDGGGGVAGGKADADEVAEADKERQRSLLEF